MLADIEARFKRVADDAVRFNRQQDALKVEPTPFEEVAKLGQDLQALDKLWRGIESWESQSKQWIATPFGAVDVGESQRKVQEYFDVASEVQKGMEANEVPQLWGAAVAQLKHILPVAAALRNKALKDRHREVIAELIGQELSPDDEGCTLGRLLDLGLGAHAEQIQEVSGRATAEVGLEEMLAKVEKEWEEMEFTINPYKEQKDVFVLGFVDNVAVSLENSLVTLATIAGSRFVSPLRERVEEWQRQLMLFQETLDEWLRVQRSWMYLESIFEVGDVKKQLPMESARFSDVDAQWCAIMRETQGYPVAKVAATKPGRLEALKAAGATLEHIHKQVEDYLVSKCVAFPRFFFLPDDDLLETRSQTCQLQAGRPHHLRKCLDSLAKLRFDESTDLPVGNCGIGCTREFV